MVTARTLCGYWLGIAIATPIELSRSEFVESLFLTFPKSRPKAESTTQITRIPIPPKSTHRFLQTEFSTKSKHANAKTQQQSIDKHKHNHDHNFLPSPSPSSSSSQCQLSTALLAAKAAPEGGISTSISISQTRETAFQMRNPPEPFFILHGSSACASCPSPTPQCHPTSMLPHYCQPLRRSQPRLPPSALASSTPATGTPSPPGSPAQAPPSRASAQPSSAASSTSAGSGRNSTTATMTVPCRWLDLGRFGSRRGEGSCFRPLRRRPPPPGRPCRG